MTHDQLDAIKLFGLNLPFSVKELRYSRNRLLKKFHPDVSGSDTTQYAVRINVSFDLLIPIATIPVRVYDENYKNRAVRKYNTIVSTFAEKGGSCRFYV